MSEVRGKLLVEQLFYSFQSLAPRKFIFSAREQDVRQYHIDNILKQIDPNCVLIRGRGLTKGAACTALLAIDQIDPDEELIVTNANDLSDVDLRTVIRHFKDVGADAGTITFESLHPRYSYVRIDKDGMVQEAAEKSPISRHATVGLFWFARGEDFLTAVQKMIRKDVNIGQKYYICPSLNELILLGKRIATWQLQLNEYHPFKSAQQLNSFDNMLDVGRFS
nr:glycosyltransferase family 2 protein [Gluconacetobacter johannae]